MRQVPFARTGIGHGLDQKIFGAQTGAKRQCLPANAHETRNAILGLYGKYGGSHGTVTIWQTCCDTPCGGMTDARSYRNHAANIVQFV
jgi:hypothetical protein